MCIRDSCIHDCALGLGVRGLSPVTSYSGVKRLCITEKEGGGGTDSENVRMHVVSTLRTPQHANSSAGFR